MPPLRRYSTKEILFHARGQWRHIADRLLPANFAEQLSTIGGNRHVACPIHGGVNDDAFRLFPDFEETGGGVCNTCGKFPTGVMLLIAILGWNEERVVEEIAAVLGIDQQSPNGSATGGGAIAKRGRGRPPGAKNKHRPGSDSVEASSNGQSSNGQSKSGNPSSKAPAKSDAAPDSTPPETIPVNEQAEIRSRTTKRWRDAIPDNGIAAGYYYHRGLSVPVPPTIRYVDRLPYAERVKGQPKGSTAEEITGYYPGLVIQILHHKLGLVALHRTYLEIDPDNTGNQGLITKARVPSPKKFTQAIYPGALMGAAMRLYPVETTGPNAGTLAITEGPETALAVHQATGVPVWAAGTAGMLGSIEIPPEITRVELWADNGEVGEHHAHEAAFRLSAEGKEVYVIIPTPELLAGSDDPIKGDWLKVLLLHGADALIAARDASVIYQRPPDVVEEITNAKTETHVDDFGREIRVAVPIPLADIIETISTRTGNWPRRVATALFVHDPDHGMAWLENTASLFGYFQRTTGIVKWNNKTLGCVGKSELFEELSRTTQNYIAVENLPHEPERTGHYYACDRPEPGDGSALNSLVDRFFPETPLDRELIMAAIVTQLWGGEGGSRPAFIITADSGRGAGKTKFVSILANLFHGMLELSVAETLDQIKARLLSPEGLSKRIVLLDNIKSLRFSWAELEALITASAISGKRMYVGEATRPNTLTWFMTLNGASLSTDLAQRSIIVKLGKPTYHGSWYEDTLAFVAANRPAIFADIVAFLRSPRKVMESASRWASWEKDVIARLPNPDAVYTLIRERQTSVDIEEEESELLEEFFAKQIFAAGFSESDVVHISLATSSRWFNWCMNENKGVSSAAALIRQKIIERKLNSISENPSRKHGRGFLWRGPKSEPSKLPNYNLDHKMMEQKKLKDKPKVDEDMSNVEFSNQTRIGFEDI